MHTMRLTLSQGGVGGGAFEYGRSAYSNAENVRNRRIKATYDVCELLYLERILN